MPAEYDLDLTRRLVRTKEWGVLTDDETETLVMAFEYIYSLVLDTEITAIRTGGPTTTTWIAPKELDTLTRRYLREAFRRLAVSLCRL